MITQEQLKTILDYNPDTGIFTWKQRTSIRITIGKPAGNTSKRDQYVRIGVLGTHWLAHRLAFLYMTGEEPKQDVDHINGNRSDNRWENLRDIPHYINCENIYTHQSHNKLGLLGAYRHGSGYRSAITVKGKQIRLGTYRTPEQAHDAYLAAKRDLHSGNML